MSPVGSAVFVDAVSSAKNREVMFSISLYTNNQLFMVNGGSREVFQTPS